MLKYAFNLFDGGFGIILPEIEDKCHWQPEVIWWKPSEEKIWRKSRNVSNSQFCVRYTFGTIL